MQPCNFASALPARTDCNSGQMRFSIVLIASCNHHSWHHTFRARLLLGYAQYRTAVGGDLEISADTKCYFCLFACWWETLEAYTTVVEEKGWWKLLCLIHIPSCLLFLPLFLLKQYKPMWKMCYFHIDITLYCHYGIVWGFAASYHDNGCKAWNQFS